MEIIFLGCGGGRLQIIDQSFRTGGFRIHDKFKLHVDPGPGAVLLTSQLGLDATDLDAVFVSHSHSDHYTDAEVLVEAMSRGESSGGRFIGSESAVSGDGDLGPVLSNYHKKMAGEVISLKPGETFEAEDLDLEATATEHGDSTGIGFKIYTDSGVVGYTGDTQFFDGLPEFFRDVRVLIANVTRPEDKRIEGHLCSKDLIRLSREVRPELSVILHMGMLFLRNSPKREAAYIEEKSGVRTVPGFVGTRIKANEDIQIDREFQQAKLENFRKFQS